MVDKDCAYRLVRRKQSQHYLKHQNMWTEISNESELDRIMRLYGSFQDSCLRDIYISTREFVNEKFQMEFENKIIASLIFQREYEPSVLELKIEDVCGFNFRPYGEITDPVIYDASLFEKEGVFYWADSNDWKIGDNDSIWVSGKKMFWRFRPELIGNTKRIVLE